MRGLARRSPIGFRAFYQTPQWKRKRRQILERDHWTCQECRRHGTYARATVVHHRVHLKDAPELALTDSNLESICAACHEHEHEEKFFRSGARRVTPERW